MQPRYYSITMYLIHLLPTVTGILWQLTASYFLSAKLLASLNSLPLNMDYRFLQQVITVQKKKTLGFFLNENYFQKTHDIK